MTLVAGPPVETQMRVNNGIFSLKRELRRNVTFCIFTDPENIMQVGQIGIIIKLTYHFLTDCHRFQHLMCALLFQSHLSHIDIFPPVEMHL